MSSAVEDTILTSPVQPPHKQMLSRRNFLIAGGVGAGTVVMGATVIKAVSDRGLPTFLRTSNPSPRDQTWHLLHRAGFGARPGQLETAMQMGTTNYIEQQLNPARINDSDCDRLLQQFSTLKMQFPEMYALKNGDATVALELEAATVLRALYSQRQLLEVMVSFWSDHFTIWHLKSYCPYLKTMDDRDVIRPNALGTFRALLGASVHSPAMLDYLDNASSLKDHPNENYARELLELHTLAPGHYTETDVKELARCLTGWGVQQNEKDPRFGSYYFDPDNHDDGVKQVLGKTIPAGGGTRDVEMVLDILATHPATIRFICTKLCRRFVGDEPPLAVITAAETMFRQSGGNIRAVVRVILHSQEFRDATPKFRRPFEYMLMLMRTFDVQVDPGPEALLDILGGLDRLSQRPFGHHTPEGYSDKGSRWMNNLLPRWNEGIRITYGSYASTHVDVIATAQRQGATSVRQILEYYAIHLLGRRLSTVENDTLGAFAHQLGEIDLTTDDGHSRLVDAVALMAIAPATQYQ